jgi:hypothetical protein
MSGVAIGQAHALPTASPDPSIGPEASSAETTADCWSLEVRRFESPAGLHADGPASDQRFSGGMLVIEGSFQVDGPNGDA